jgi:glycerol-1-phosphate dehydrogenase [NAD(P)+]
MILSGRKTRKIAGEEIYANLEENNLSYETLIVDDASLENSLSVSKEVQNYKANVLVACGGGKTIDVGKFCTFKSQNRIELISVPTSTPHDGIASPFIFLNDPTEQFIGECRPPVSIVADIDIIKQHPDLYRFLAAGVGDTVGKITAIWDWRYAHRIKSVKFSRFVGGVLEKADTLFQNQVTEAIVDPENAIKVVLKALLIAGVLMGTSNDRRVGYGSEHMFAGALDAEIGSNILHGERVALGTIMMAKLQGQDYMKIKHILESAGCPTSINELEEEINTKDILQALQKAHKIDPMYTILGSTGISADAALNVALETKVIDQGEL